MLRDLFRDTQRRILEIVDQYEMSKGHNREVTAYLAFLTFAVLDDQAASLIPVRPDEFMYQRFRLYAGLSHSDLLNNWHCPDIPDMNDNPLFTAFVAFGDLLINRSARNDYRSASFVIPPLTETVLFSESMLKEVLPITDRYIDHLIMIRKSAESSRQNSFESPESARTNEHRSQIVRRNIIIGFLLALVLIFFFSSQHDSDKDNRSVAASTQRVTSTPTVQPSRNNASQSELLNYYQLHFPMVWGYISKNADDPFSYLQFYDSVWGDLQWYTGDGINFATLTPYEQKFVNYPAIGAYIYFSYSTAREYHSTDQCYTLLKSEPIARPSTQRNNYSPCSKCVGD